MASDVVGGANPTMKYTRLYVRMRKNSIHYLRQRIRELYGGGATRQPNYTRCCGWRVDWSTKHRSEHNHGRIIASAHCVADIAGKPD